jgi:glutamate racemase
MTDSNAPIGVLDSGVGGLTVARVLLDQLPNERLLYFADTAHLPYGPRPICELRQLALDIIAFLFDQGAKAVVIGSNSSDTAALEAAREQYGPLVFGTIRPGARAALSATQNGRIGILATIATVSTHAYADAIHEIQPDAHVTEQSCPEFVPLVERGELDSSYTRKVAQEYLAPILAASTDTVVFGCTQYPLLRPLLQELVGPHVRLVDPAEQAVCDVTAGLGEAGLLAQTATGANRFFASGDPSSLMTVGANFLGRLIERVEAGDIWKDK